MSETDRRALLNADTSLVLIPGEKRKPQNWHFQNIMVNYSRRSNNI